MEKLKVMGSKELAIHMTEAVMLGKLIQRGLRQGGGRECDGERKTFRQCQVEGGAPWWRWPRQRPQLWTLWSQNGGSTFRLTPRGVFGNGLVKLTCAAVDAVSIEEAGLGVGSRDAYLGLGGRVGTEG